MVTLYYLEDSWLSLEKISKPLAMNLLPSQAKSMSSLMS